MKIRYDVISDVGRVRSNNEDMALVFGAFVRDGADGSMVKMDSRPRFTALVADGMGGYGGGEIASELTLRSFDQFIVNLAPDLDDTEVRVRLNQWLDTHQNLIRAEQQKPGLEQMGTTLTGIFTYGDREYMINAGDSRVYRWRNNNLRQLSVDHSERERLNDPSVPSNLIYNAIGVPDAFLTITDLTDRYPIVDGDTYVICSDGLCDMINDDAIASILENGGGARELVDAALEAGGKDNCTVIVLNISKPEAEEAPAEPVMQSEPAPETEMAPEPLSVPEPEEAQEQDIAFVIDTPSEPAPPAFSPEEVVTEAPRPLFVHNEDNQETSRVIST
ncbi:MAG: protein phosphatase 2C domain-containing protein, partial [Muribaculaceae bacterium]|nr:protein phosphatase 2C domain-containing protein [Muribaculaceae bacterium]